MAPHSEFASCERGVEPIRESHVLARIGDEDFSFGLMVLALRSLPFGTAYAVWTGIGAAGSIIVGMLIFSESADPVRIFCLTLIVAGMVGLKLNSPV